MQRYRHGPSKTIVEAVRLDEDNVYDVAVWAGNAPIIDEIDPFTEEKSQGLNIMTASGMRRVSQGQYVVKFGKHFSMARPSTFEAYYIPAEQPPGLVETDNARKALGFESTESRHVGMGDGPK